MELIPHFVMQYLVIHDIISIHGSKRGPNYALIELMAALRYKLAFEYIQIIMYQNITRIALANMLVINT